MMQLKKIELSRGFSLVEVLAVLIVIAILAMLAFPSYIEAVRRSKRAEGKAALARLMQQEELFYSRRNTYIQFSNVSTGDEEKKFKWYSGSTPQKSAYEIRAEACEHETIQHCVLLTATPGTSNVDGSFKDPACGILALSSAGTKTANSQDCWR